MRDKPCRPTEAGRRLCQHVDRVRMLELELQGAVPDLPLYVLGRLYHQLCVACWRQDKFAEAEAHNATTLDMARRCDDRALLADALGSQANLRFWRGEVAGAISTWQQALALAPESWDLTKRWPASLPLVIEDARRRLLAEGCDDEAFAWLLWDA